MENASKALIIAGAILLSILIIGLGMAVFQNVKSSISDVNLDKEQVEAINSQYTPYIGTAIKGSKIKSLCELVKNSNLTAADATTDLVTINGVTAATDIDALKNKIANGKTYGVTATYEGPSGTIDTITITGDGLK